jgi:hypothetical protein
MEAFAPLVRTCRMARDLVLLLHILRNQREHDGSMRVIMHPYPVAQHSFIPCACFLRNAPAGRILQRDHDFNAVEM